jgi:hypothetical protein
VCYTCAPERKTFAALAAVGTGVCMKAGKFWLAAVVFVMLICSNRGVSQSDDGSAALPFVKLTASTPVMPRGFRPLSGIGIESYAGVGGIGFDVATPVLRKFNVRAGSEFFRYSTTFQDQGATVAIAVRAQSGHASLDWFPFSSRFRLSPLIVFANNNRVQATALIPPGNTVTLNGQDYISSVTDPLHGAGSIDFRKASPGFSLGFGNVVPRTSSHFSFPIEAGFYYVGQPGLKVSFTGSACDPLEPPAIGCQSVNQDGDFQQSLAGFVARNNHNLSYISFFPIFSFGFGYAFSIAK